MNITYHYQGIHFEWDSQKAESNLAKHGVSFETACEVFFDPFVRLLDMQEVGGELRNAVIGMTTDWRILYVVHLVNERDTFRIISARPATRAERKQYENQ